MRNKNNKNNKNKIIIIVVLILSMVVISAIILFNNKKINREITILDSNGNEIYIIKDKLNEILDNEMIIPDNGAVDSIILQVINDIQSSLNYSNKQAIKLLNSKDFIVYSTIDMKIQEKLDEAFNDRSTFTSTKKADFNQASMVIMDYEGNIKAVATGNNNDNTKNRASNTLLKVGSTIKPVAIYTPAIDKDLVTFSTIIDDYPGNTFIDGNAVPWPTNYDNKYERNVTITDALKKSKNTIAVKVGEMVGQDAIYEFLEEKLDYSTLDSNNDKQLSALALGYFNNGISLDTLVASYSMFGNDGYYSGKKYYTEVVTSDGKSIISNNSSKLRVISEESATIMNRLLHNNIVDDDSIIKDLGIDGIEVLGKTGTVGNDNDEIISQLFVGMTPEYVAGVWIGYDDERPIMPNGYNYPSNIWKKIMLNMNYKISNFQLSNNIYKEEYCSESGLIKSDNCKNIKSGYYKKEQLLDFCNSCK